MRPWYVRMATQNLLKLLLLLMLMLRIMLATVCYRFGSWCLVLKLNLCADFEHKVWSRFCSWSSGNILKLDFVQHFAADVLNFKFSGDAGVWLRFLVNALLRFWGWNVIRIRVWTCDMTSRSYFCKMNSTLGSVVPLAMFHNRFNGHFHRNMLTRTWLFECLFHLWQIAGTCTNCAVWLILQECHRILLFKHWFTAEHTSKDYH